MKTLCVILGLTLTATLAACGGGGSADSSSSASNTDVELTKATWIAHADDVCRGYERETENLTAEVEALHLSAASPPEDLVKASKLLRRIAVKSEAEIDALRELEPPSGDEETIDTMLSKVEEARTVGVRAADALENDEEAELEDLIKDGNEIEESANAAAQDYGLEVCG